MYSEGLSIKCRSRLHLSLFSMHDSGIRINGGIGFAIEFPSITLRATPSLSYVINDTRRLGLSLEAKNRLINRLVAARRQYSLPKAVTIDIGGDAVAGHGFGSGTAVGLSSVEALMCVNGRELSKNELIYLSGRGGTSGIGINTYFSGGAVLDLGIKNSNCSHRPSSAVDSIVPPLLLQQHDMPCWNFGICIPLNIEPMTKEQEETFFKIVCPIKESEAHKSLYHSVVGVMGAICENDKDAFEYSIRELQKCEWKKAERTFHGGTLQEIEELLYRCGASAVGMSSLGPSLYFLANDVNMVINRTKKILQNCEFVMTTPDNLGRKIQCLS